MLTEFQYQEVINSCVECISNKIVMILLLCFVCGFFSVKFVIQLDSTHFNKEHICKNRFDIHSKH